MTKTQRREKMKSKIVKCVDCGTEYPRKELNRNFRCHDCAWKKAGEIPVQLMAQSGPEYEKWKQSMKAVAERL